MAVKKKGGTKRPAPASLPALAEELVAQPREKANNLPRLLAALKPGCAEATPVLHHLRIFFIDSFDRGDLSVKPPAEDDKSAEAVYAAWLHRQYSTYTAALLRLLGHAEAEPRTQVAAFIALMECVRGERPGVFNNRLFHRAFERLVCQEGAAPEVLGLLIGKFLELADVRFFTLSSLAKLAQHSKAQRNAAQQGAGKGSDDEASDDEALGEAAAEDGGRVSPHDLARTLHDLLAEMPPMPAGMEGPGQAAGGAAAAGEDEEGEAEEPGLQSWCGAAEMGLVVAANTGEGARQRKRQRLAAEAAAAATAATGQQQRAKWANLKAQHRMYSDAWLALLRMDLPEDIYKKVLARMHDLIIPSLVKPVLLADFLTATLDKGGLTGMLALNGIFELVTKHGLEYPHFYRRLYGLITPEVFHAKHRARFWVLADAFLASGMVPAYTAAAFVKRLARLALAAPPAGALLALGFMHNVVRRHPATMQLLHRPPRGGLAAVGAAAAGAAPAAPAPQPLLPLPPQVAGGQPVAAADQQQEAADGAPAAANGSADAAVQQVVQAQQQRPLGPAWQGEDVYDYAEPDPAASRALESSLWELEALRCHHNPQVAAYCAVLDKDLRDRKKTSEVDVSEAMAAGYASMFGSEVSRRLKQVPTAFYRSPPEALFADAACAADWAGWALATLTPTLGSAQCSIAIPPGQLLRVSSISAQGCPAQSMQRFPLWTDAVLTLAVTCGNRPPAQLWRSDWVRHKYDSVRMYWVPHFGGACYSPNVLLSGGVTFTASFTLPDGTPLGGEMAPWTGSNAPTVHIVGNLVPEDNVNGLCSGKRHQALHM
ncbi:nucleolar complex 4-like protein [Chlorella sorokiniana]|uniref:Nucleolar complex 4-like protein n=1 Tax=Chlorella sorokiniana TaxID=3076 RepID=A0A2P6TKC1_CHLSO|nr:nucleolar complex 4-like protein [Chlorella sorokiniana]|eukprot:PRW44488.1 nucleolar complex 4-like protein [Chlorella sorokiniana]